MCWGLARFLKTPLNPQNCRKEEKILEKDTFIFCATTLVCNKPWFKRDLSLDAQSTKSQPRQSEIAVKSRDLKSQIASEIAIKIVSNSVENVRMSVGIVAEIAMIRNRCEVKSLAGWIWNR